MNDISLYANAAGLIPTSTSLDSDRIASLFAAARPTGKSGETRKFYGQGPNQDQTVVVISTGESVAGATEAQENKLKEQSRHLGAVATLSLSSPHPPQSVTLSTLHSAHSTAVGAILSNFKHSLKTSTSAIEDLQARKNLKFEFLPQTTPDLASEKATETGRNALNAKTGKIYADAQNFARTLMEMPANLMTPTIFCERASERLAGAKNVVVHVHDRAWAESKNMGSFISVSKGSDQPLRFFEAHYTGTDKTARPIALVGKGVTFDCGGISIKGAAKMADMRADMGGAATTLSAFCAVVEMGLPVNVSLFIPLTENLINGSATKPGDVVYAGNGLSINVDNTDAEGRLILADALWYASNEFNPHTIIDAATLTGAMCVALGNQFTGVFTNSSALFDALASAGAAEHDPVWRMPLHEGYMSQINATESDLKNTGGRDAGACTAAIFLKRFVKGLVVDGVDQCDKPANLINWAHLDIAGVMDLASSSGYNRAGMTGRPTRTMIEFIRRSGDVV